MRATVRVEDRRIESAMVTFGLGLMLLSFATFFSWDAAFMPAGCVGMSVLVAAPLFRMTRRRRFADVEVVRGSLVVRVPGRIDHRLRLHSLTGGSTSRIGDRVALALRFGTTPMPIVIELENEDEAKSLRAALDIAVTGVGALVWKRGKGLLEGIARALHQVVAVGCFAMVVASLNGPTSFVAVALVELAFATSFLVAKATTLSNGTTISLTNGGMYVAGEGAATYPWRAIASVDVERHAFALTLEERRDERFPPQRSIVRISHEGLDDDDVALIADQIRAASARTRGVMRVGEQLVQSILAPHDDESVGEWIRRIDGLADGWRVSPPRHGETESYRTALWATLEDHDADPLVRALAARVLSRLDRDAIEPKLRVVLETVRDETHVARFRAAVEPDSEPFAIALEKGKRGA